MKMYSIFLHSEEFLRNRSVGDGGKNLLSANEAEAYLSNYIIHILETLGVAKLEVVYEEVNALQEFGKLFSVQADKEALLTVLKSLTKDESVLTLGWPHSILLIPFEGYQFNVIINDALEMPPDSFVELTDSTDVLMDFADAYDSFGVTRMFPRAFRDYNT